MLGQYLSYVWVKKSLDHHTNIKVLFTIDLREYSNSLEETIVRQRFPEIGRSTDDIKRLIIGREKNILFILDHYEDYLTKPKMRDDVAELINRQLYPRCHYVLLVHSRQQILTTTTYKKHFDTKLILHGFKQGSQEELISKYDEATHPTTTLLIPDRFTALILRSLNDNDVTIRTLTQTPLFCTCMCLITEMREPMDFDTVTGMLDTFVNALLKLYCKNNGLKMTDSITPEIVGFCIHNIEQLALNIIHNRTIFEVHAAYFEHNEIEVDLPLYEFGLLRPSIKNPGSAKFYHRIFQEFLTARVLSQTDMQEFKPYLKTLISEKYLQNVCRLLCGLLKYDTESETLKELIKGLADFNRIFTRKLSFVGEADNEGVTSEGSVVAYQRSLECMAELQERPDLCTIIMNHLPNRLIMKRHEVLSNGTIRGLSYVLKFSEAPSVNELDLRFDHIAKCNAHDFLFLAEQLEKSHFVTMLKIRWTDPELMAEFLAKVFGKNIYIEFIRCSDISHQPGDKISATAWANLKTSCENMQCVKTFDFVHCRNYAIVAGLLHNLPPQIQHLSLVSCQIDAVCSQELAKRLEKTNIVTLNLMCTIWQRADFIPFCNGICLSKKLKELNLSGTTLDTSLDALGEALKFNKSIKNLDLSNMVISDSTCHDLGYSLSINQGVKQLILLNTTMSPDGQSKLKKLMPSKIKLIGLKEEKVIGLPYAVPLREDESKVHHLPVIKKKRMQTVKL